MSMLFFANLGQVLPDVLIGTALYGLHRQSRSFALRDLVPRTEPRLNPDLLRLSAMISKSFKIRKAPSAVWALAANHFVSILSA